MTKAAKHNVTGLRPVMTCRRVLISNKLVNVFLRVRSEEPLFFQDCLMPALDHLEEYAGQEPDRLVRRFFIREVGGRAVIAYRVSSDTVKVAGFRFRKSAQSRL